MVRTGTSVMRWHNRLILMLSGGALTLIEIYRAMVQAGAASSLLFIRQQVTNHSGTRRCNQRYTTIAHLLDSSMRYFLLMPINIHKATPKDTSLLIEMMREFYSESDYSLDEQWATDSLSTLLSNTSYGAIWIAAHDDKPVGYIVLTVRFSMEHGELVGLIDDLFVYSRYRRRGVGQALLKELFAECQPREVRIIQVEVGSDNVAAKALYQKHGLQVRADDRQVLTASLQNFRAPLKFDSI